MPKRIAVLVFAFFNGYIGVLVSMLSPMSFGVCCFAHLKIPAIQFTADG